LREEDNEKHIIQQRRHFDVAILDIGQQSNLLEGVKGDRQRHNQSREMEISPEQIGDILHEEVAILEVAKQAQIKPHGQPEEAPSGAPLDADGQEVIHPDLRKQQKQEWHAPVSVEGH
jgi:hypothetical protein